MRLRDSYRVPILLVSCLVTALMFPRACSETRVGFGAFLPATAPLTGAEREDGEAALREENARLTHEIDRLFEERDARPGADGPLAGVPIVRAGSQPTVLIAARVTHRDPSPMRRSFSIGAGRDDGVREGLPVVFGGSIVGLVVSATGHAARAVRIDDPTTASTLRVTILGSARTAALGRPSGIARGNGDGGVTVSMLNPGDARPGDVVVTGVGNLGVPEGLVIGEVVRFGDDDRDSSFEAEVRPFRDLDTMNSVHVLRTDAVAPADKR